MEHYSFNSVCSMKDWLKLFTKNDDVLLTLNGKTFKKSDCQRLGGGNEKDVYQIKGTNQCFFIPHRIDPQVIWEEKVITSEELWNIKIENEKFLLDHINKLGLKTQRFTIVPLQVEEPGKPPLTLNVLVTKDFNSLCEEESLVIYNFKGDQKISGNPPNFMEMKDQFKDKNFVHKMLKKIIADYAVAFTFSLPISILHSVDDSEHMCFELPKEAGEPPVPRYMFWDVVSDFSSIDLPLVPTLEELKSGSSDKYPRCFNTPLSGLESLANQIASAMMVMSSYTPDTTSWAILRSIEADLIAVLNEENFLNVALTHARKLASEFIDDVLKDEELKNKINHVAFVQLMQSVISVGEFDLFLRAYQLLPADMPQEHLVKITYAAKKYKVQPIIDYLNTHLVQEQKPIEIVQIKPKEKKLPSVSQQLKIDFLRQYDEALTKDKGAWCGIYSFFAKSYANKAMSLKELVEHAQGRSAHGSGKRSKEIMKTMGWLDENNEVTDKISSYIM